MPIDIDPWWELNNGRTLTLFDLGRLPFAIRVGLVDTIKQEGWGLAIAGASVRYRRRIRMFDRIEMRSRMVGWDNRFFYIEQTMWRSDGVCANHSLFRTAVTGPDGIVPPEQVARKIDPSAQAQALPDWVATWTESEAIRPWPPMQDPAQE